ncbi:MAG: rRNA maturation RNase YbeY [Candidatus Improbicoccus pseudotrichonymphae]|uniref:Endoribonuclease YbeY n=1 Tax=Candidatus Improbicoccus pseudotrichonymphae TaxID=3033792 RepID=A0AA48HV08_9FIRM|nr:MAG: rRNA maturation RNase YbeY [Candidatus Improbicoccus pseudotrichonymphae]
MADIYRVGIVNKQKTIKVPTGLRLVIRRCCNAVIKSERLEGLVEVCVMLTNNEEIKSLNKQYKNNDNPTDVLSFPRSTAKGFDINPENGAKILGDVVISLEKAEEQSRENERSLQHEVAGLVVHGMLHLFNYDHERNEKERFFMSQRQESILELVGFKATD